MLWQLQAQQTLKQHLITADLGKPHLGVRGHAVVAHCLADGFRLLLLLQPLTHHCDCLHHTTTTPEPARPLLAAILKAAVDLTQLRVVKQSCNAGTQDFSSQMMLIRCGCSMHSSVSVQAES